MFKLNTAFYNTHSSAKYITFCAIKSKYLYIHKYLQCYFSTNNWLHQSAKVHRIPVETRLHFLGMVSLAFERRSNQFFHATQSNPVSSYLTFCFGYRIEFHLSLQNECANDPTYHCQLRSRMRVTIHFAEWYYPLMLCPNLEALTWILCTVRYVCMRIWVPWTGASVNLIELSYYEITDALPCIEPELILLLFPYCPAT